MEQDRTEIQIQELIALEPSLKEYEADLRAMLALMLAKRPNVQIDAAFRTALRERILTAQPKAIVSPYTKLSWWAVRLVPVGAVALLLITLVPGDILHAPTVIEEHSVLTVEDTTETMGAPEAMPVSQSDTLYVSSAPSQKMGGGGVTDMSMAEEDSMLRTMNMDASPESFFIVSEQLPGMSIVVESVTTQVPAFIRISRYDDDGEETIVGISPLIMPGTTSGVPIYLARPSHVSERYTATLVEDNGNRLFTSTEDMPLLPPFEFEIVSGYFE